MRIALTATALLLITGIGAILAFVSPGWLLSETVDAADAEHDIRSMFPERFTGFFDVSCPDDEPAVAGHQFQCTVTNGSETIQAEVTVRADGQRPYAVELSSGRVFDGRAVEQGVVQILGGDQQIENVQCPDGEPAEQDHTFTCSATVNGEQVQIPITVTDAEADPPIYRVDGPR